MPSPAAERIVRGDVRALARAASAVENRRPEAVALMKELFPHTGRATILGVTGAPGAGKSTLVDRLAEALRAQTQESAPQGGRGHLGFVSRINVTG
jgi:LAO/AO transport system kinase